jgi:hypothetical protein
LATTLLSMLLASVSFAGSPTRGARVSRISEADNASEYWDIVARFDSGYSLFTRFLITHEGPGKHTGVVTWYLVAPDGRMVPFRNGRRRERWTLSPDGARIRIGSSILDQRGSVHALEYDSKKRGISIALRFSPDGPVAWTDAAVPGGLSLDLLDLGTPVVGSVWLQGMAEPMAVNGTVSVTHRWMDESEADIALRRIEFASAGVGPLLYVSHLTTPDGQQYRWLVIERDGEVLYQSNDFDVTLPGAGRQTREGYPIPGVIYLHNAEIEGQIAAGPVLLETDPLNDIPQPFRFLLSFKTRPHRAWTGASFEVTLKASPNLAPLQFRGTGVTSITFLNPLPPAVEKSAAGKTQRGEGVRQGEAGQSKPGA